MYNNLNMIETLHILLVEDDFEIGNWLKKRIEALDNISSLQWETNLEDSYAFLVKNTPDILILDLKLPDGSGIDLIKKIKRDKISTKIFIFSINSELKNTCLRLGVDKFFDKSSDSEALIAHVKERRT